MAGITSSATRLKGFVLAFIAAATYGLNPLFALPLISDGMDVASIIFFRYLFAVGIVASMTAARHKPFRVSKGELGMLALLGFAMSLSSIGLFESYKYMDAGIASTILFIYPLMVALIMGIFYHERIRLLTVFCLITALGGIGLLYKGDGGGTLSASGTALVIFSSLMYALYIVGVNKSRVARTPTLTVSFYVLLFGLTPLAVNILAQGFISIPSGLSQWAGVAALAFFPTAVSFICTTLAILYIGSTPTAILGAMEPVTAVIVGVFVFNERLTGQDFVGLSLIIIAVTLVVIGDKISRPLVHIRKLFPKTRK